MNIKIRKAIPGDAPGIENLYKILVPDDENICVSPYRIEEISENDTNELFIIDIDEKVSGTAFITICLDPMYNNQPYAVIENIIVEPSCQRNGIGNQLMREIENYCWSRRCTKIMLLSSIHRKESHTFFKMNGFSGAKKKGFVKYNRDKNKDFTQPAL